MNDPNQLSLNCERKISSRQVSKRRIKAVLFSTIFTKDGFCQIMTDRDCHGISDTGMNPQELAGYLDELIFSSTGKHIEENINSQFLREFSTDKNMRTSRKSITVVRVTPKMKPTNSGNFFRIR